MIERTAKNMIFPKKEQKRIFEHFKRYVNKRVLPDKNIEEIKICGSLINGRFRKYKNFQIFPLYKRLYSDIDMMMIVNDKFKIRKQWKLMTKKKYYSIYRITIFENKFHVICHIIPKRNLKKLSSDKHMKYVWLYKKK